VLTSSVVVAIGLCNRFRRHLAFVRSGISRVYHPLPHLIGYRSRDKLGSKVKQGPKHFRSLHLRLDFGAVGCRALPPSSADSSAVLVCVGSVLSKNTTSCGTLRGEAPSAKCAGNRKQRLRFGVADGRPIAVEPWMASPIKRPSMRRRRFSCSSCKAWHRAMSSTVAPGGAAAGSVWRQPV
jgi:hypothetical protein